MKSAASYLFSHTWKSFIRNERWRRNLFIRILYLFIGLYFIVTFLILGYDISNTLADDSTHGTERFYEWIIWYLVADYIIRCLLQQVPAVEVIPYLRFRIRKRKLTGHLIIRSGFSLFNFLPLFLIIPFAAKVIGPSSGMAATLLFLSGSLLMIMFNNLLALLTGLLTRISPFYWGIPLAYAGIIALINYLAGSIKEISRLLGTAMTDGRLLFFSVVIGLIISIILIIRRVVGRNLQIDKVKTRQGLRIRRLTSAGFRQMGDTGRYMSLEISMLLRNKRSRNAMLLAVFFLIYGFFFFFVYDTPPGRYLNMVITTMVMGLASMSYLQLIFSWESAYFDGIMARKNNFFSYIKAKFYLQAIMSMLTFIPVIVMIVISGRVNIFLALAIFLYVLGPNSFIAMLLATMNDARLDLSGGTFMNYQGVKGSQFLMTFIFILLPVCIFELVCLVAGDTGGIIALALLGAIFLLFHNWWLRHIIAAAFLKRKYKSLEGYRKLSA